MPMYSTSETFKLKFRNLIYCANLLESDYLSLRERELAGLLSMSLKEFRHFRAVAQHPRFPRTPAQLAESYAALELYNYATFGANSNDGVPFCYTNLGGSSQDLERTLERYESDEKEVKRICILQFLDIVVQTPPSSTPGHEQGATTGTQDEVTAPIPITETPLDKFHPTKCRWRTPMDLDVKRPASCTTQTFTDMDTLWKHVANVHILPQYRNAYPFPRRSYASGICFAKLDIHAASRS
ncbi:hypothetical protein FA15DRAFT_758545 [Coprinopsis marcescibilis]|uniref:Uncharacterized protein n=1 Tax=Coprinopsis marcescibilis TaxID=230819 RepID=A0A5C3KMT8_COPMA|nr:hypothetical protein FA15DRAFT_758545 [Coprinopsis marcescibilis]